MRHFAFITLLTLGALPATTGQARVQTADEIIDKHIAALGGRPALAKLVSRHATGSVTLSVQGNDLSGTYEAYAKAPNKTRVVLKIDTTAVGGPGDMVIDQRFDGVAAVVMNSLQGDTVITGNQLENMRNGSFPSAMLSYKEKGVKVELLPREKLANQEMIVLQATPKTGSTIKVYLDPATFLIARTVAKVSTPEMGDLEQTVEFSDYRAADGTKVAFQTVNSTPAQTITVKIAKVEHNVTIDDAMFTKK
jgi:outer membrane lipoprotein-sorting protein